MCLLGICTCSYSNSSNLIKPISLHRLNRVPLGQGSALLKKDQASHVTSFVEKPEVKRQEITGAESQQEERKVTGNKKRGKGSRLKQLKRLCQSDIESFEKLYKMLEKQGKKRLKQAKQPSKQKVQEDQTPTLQYFSVRLVDCCLPPFAFRNQQLAFKLLLLINQQIQSQQIYKASIKLLDHRFQPIDHLRRVQPLLLQDTENQLFLRGECEFRIRVGVSSEETGGRIVLGVELQRKENIFFAIGDILII